LGLTVNDSVVTQFTEAGLKQFFIQDGARIDIPTPTWEGLPETNEVGPELCDVLFDVFDDYDRYTETGGWPAIVDALAQPQVLVLSIWADVSTSPFSLRHFTLRQTKMDMLTSAV
jgi:cellulose 1,4-beta-cellobiosidase